MNLNNWLCKHFGEKGKDVTIGDVFDPIIDIGLKHIELFVCCVFIFFMGGLIYALIQGMMPSEPGDIKSLFIMIVTAWILPIEIIIGIAIILIVGYYIIKLLEIISQIKIAKCPVTEKEENK